MTTRGLVDAVIMCSRTTAGVLLVSLLLSVRVAHGEPPPLPVIDPHVRHPVDQMLRLSADGNRLVWVRVRDLKLSLCALEGPFAGQRSELLLGPAVSPLPSVCVSLDGRHVFWDKDGDVWHASLEKARFGEPSKLPIKAGRFGLQTNADGSVLTVLIDGPNTPTISPSYRALVTATRTGDGWTQQPPLTPVEHGKLASGTLLDGPGRYLVFTLDGHKQVTRGQDGWKVSPLEFPGYSLHPAALSADGQVMLLRGRKADEQPARPEIVNLSHVWMSRRRGDQWQAPELVLRDREVNYYNEAMSPDGRWLMWVEYDRDADGKIVRTRLRRMRHEDQGWAEPQNLVEQEGYLQFWNTAVADNGTAAWTTICTTIAGQPWKGYVCMAGGKAICLD